MNSLEGLLRGGTTNVSIGRIESPADDVRIFDLVPLDGRILPPFEAGANVTVYLPSGLSRQYSVASNPADLGRYAIAVKREATSRGGSRAMHELAVGQGLTISRPVNAFSLKPADSYLLLGGGIGMTPLIAMAHSLSASGLPFELHHFARHSCRLDVFQSLMASAWRDRIRGHGSDRDGPARESLKRLGDVAVPGTGVYVCGPAGFIDCASSLFRPIVGAGNVHSELFAPATRLQEIDGGDAAFTVETETGISVEVSADMTIVEALRGAGVKIETSCELGICGTCQTRVLEGDIDHRDEILTDEEKASGEWIIPCVSRCTSARLKLKL